MTLIELIVGLQVGIASFGYFAYEQLHEHMTQQNALLERILERQKPPA